MGTFLLLKGRKGEGIQGERLDFCHGLLCCLGRGRALPGVEKLPGAEELFPNRATYPPWLPSWNRPGLLGLLLQDYSSIPKWPRPSESQCYPFLPPALSCSIGTCSNEIACHGGHRYWGRRTCQDAGWWPRSHGSGLWRQIPLYLNPLNPSFAICKLG